MKEYNEQVVETLDDAGCIIANKNIIIDNLQARIAELEAENARLRFALADTEALELGTSERLPHHRPRSSGWRNVDAKFVDTQSITENILDVCAPNSPPSN